MTISNTPDPEPTDAIDDPQSDYRFVVALDDWVWATFYSQPGYPPRGQTPPD